MLAALFIASGLVHLVRPRVYLTMMPPYLPYPSELILVSGVAEIAGGIGLLLPPTRRVARYGLIALLTGRQLTGIRLHSDTSGLTVSRGKPHGLGMILTAAAGYTAPPLLGLGGAALLAVGHITLLLWLATALLVAMLVMIRNAYGALTVVLTGGAFLLVSWLAGPQVQAAFAYAVVWFLLVGGVRPAFELQAKRMRGGAGDSDADQLSRLTHVPAGLWLFLFHAVSLCSLIGGGRWLLEM